MEGLIVPFARALELLEAWTPQDRWLGIANLTARTGLARTTVTRLIKALLELGYLHQDALSRKYRLTSAVLALGYATFSTAAVRRVARTHMQTYANESSHHVLLTAREGLRLRALERCSSSEATGAIPLKLRMGIDLASSPIGWALLACLPERERFDLLDDFERGLARDGRRLKRRSFEGIAQVQASGWCVAFDDSDRDIGIIAAPLLLPERPPMVLASVGASAAMSRASVERVLGPRLLAMADGIVQESLPALA